MAESDRPPEELRVQAQWVCWGYRCRGCSVVLGPDVSECPECGGENSKPPLAPVDGQRYASTGDPETWRSYADAVAYHGRQDTDTAGVGFMLSSSGLFAGADIDGCRDAVTGAIEPWARDVIDRLDSYTEVSPSGTGLRVFVMGSLPDGGNRAGQPRTLDALRDADKNSELELYDSGRYLTFTGDHLDGTPKRVHARSDALDAVHGEYVADSDESSDAQAQPARSTPNGDVTLTDRKLLEKARDAENGRKFSRLYDDGDLSDYESHSEARMALLNMLAFWTGKDAGQIDRLYRDSALYPHPEEPGKWGRLGDSEIRKAIRNCSDTYSGRQTSRVTEEPASAVEDGGRPEVSLPTMDGVGQALADLGNASTSEIVGHAAVDRGEVQVHRALKHLESRGIVAWERDGRSVAYELVDSK